MFQSTQNSRRKNNFKASALILVCIICLLTGCSGDAAAGDKLIVACGDDTAGILIKYVIESGSIAEEQDAEAQQVGDCCGSNSQFALSTGDIDIAIVCPDAIQFLPADGEDYIVAGTVTYDANLLVRKTESDEIPASIGYMNNRAAQVDILRNKFGDGPDLKQMYASGLSYALETDAVEAVVLDSLTALALDYPFEKLTEGEASSVMVVRKDLLEDERFLRFAEEYNEMVDRLSDEGELTALLDTYLRQEQEGDNTDEGVLSKWKGMGVSFGKIDY